MTNEITWTENRIEYSEKTHNVRLLKLSDNSFQLINLTGWQSVNILVNFVTHQEPMK